MAENVFFSFRFIPSNVVVGTGLFTVPVDTYALMTGHVSASAAASYGAVQEASAGGSASSNDIEQWLDEGDTVNTATSAASASTSSANTSISATSTADILINATIACRAVAHARSRTANGVGPQANVSGAVAANYAVSEFPKP